MASASMKTQTNNHPIKKHPIIAACGLDCGLCPAFHRDTKSRCPGCCGEGFWDNHPGCAFITCCVKQKGLEVCAQCVEFEFCPRIMKHLKIAASADSLLSYLPIAGNFEFVQKYGIEAWVKREKSKMAFLENLLKNYNDGRSKSFYCLSLQLLPLEHLKKALAQTPIGPETTIKDKAKLVREAFNAVAVENGLELRLRGKSETS
jgi:hypothetical protein